MSDQDLYDVTLIGAGPTGLFGAFYAGLREMKVKVIDALEEPGGQLTALYPEKLIFDVPGFPRILSMDLVKNLVDQTGMFKPTLVLGERVGGLTREEDGTFTLETDRGTHRSRTVVVAAGVGAFKPKKLPNPELVQYEGNGLHYWVRDKSVFRGQDVLIVGGGDSAVDWALNLEPDVRKVFLIHRRDEFRAHGASVTALKNSSVDIRLFHELKTAEGEGKIERAVIFDNRTKEETVLPVHGVILTLGYSVDLGPIKTWGLELLGNRYIKVNTKMETNLPGVYAAGDIAGEPGIEPLNLIVEGFAQACRAVNFAYQYLHPGAKAFPGHSSTMNL